MKMSSVGRFSFGFKRKSDRFGVSAVSRLKYNRASTAWKQHMRNTMKNTNYYIKYKPKGVKITKRCRA